MEKERGRVLVLSAAIDESLRRLLAAYLLEHKVSERLLCSRSNAPLGTFSARIKMAYALGLISEVEFNDLEVVREIRNDFAHRIDVALDGQRLHDLCKNFKMVPKSNVSEDGSREVILGNDPLFLVTAVVLLDALFFRAAAAAKERRSFTFTPLEITTHTEPVQPPPHSN